jgi:hypothetical protein
MELVTLNKLNRYLFSSLMMMMMMMIISYDTSCNHADRWKNKYYAVCVCVCGIRNLRQKFQYSQLVNRTTELHYQLSNQLQLNVNAIANRYSFVYYIPPDCIL